MQHLNKQSDVPVDNSQLQLLHKIQVNNYITQTIEHDGITYLTAPVVLLTEGVHAGSAGPIFYSAEELSRFPAAWNGIPLPVNHPDDGQGNFLSAGDPNVVRDWSVGRLWNVRWDATTNKLRGEIWVDVNRCQRLAPAILTRLRNNQPLEVSTGLFSDAAQEPGTWNNEQYHSIARNFRPDHLALLPNSIGACSIADGCGITSNTEGALPMKTNKNEINVMKGEERVAVKFTANKSLTNIFGLLSNEVGFREIGQKLQRMLDGMDRRGAIHYLVELFETDFIYKVIGEDNTVTMFRSGYILDAAGNVQMTGTPVEVMREVNYPPVTTITGNGEAKDPDTNTTEASCNCGGKAPVQITDNNEQEEQPMKNTEERKVKVNTVLAAEIGYTEDNRADLEGMECNMFAPIFTMAEGKEVETPTPDTNEEEVPAVETATPAAEDAPDTNAVAVEFYNNTRTKLIETLTGNDSGYDAKELEGLDVNLLQKMAGKLAPAVAAVTTNEETALVVPTMNFSGKATTAVVDANAGGETVLEQPQLNFDTKH